MQLGLEGQVAIVTGASRGLGLAAARALIGEGVRVLACARSAAPLEALAAEFPGQVHAQVCDMTDLAAVAALPAAAVSAFGRLDIVVNNAGLAPAGRFMDQGPDVWQEVFAVNVFAPAELSRAAGAIFLEQRSGKIINIASTSGILGKPLLAAYSASKGAMLQMTKALGSEWAGRGIQVNAIAPGAYETDAQAAVLDDPKILERRLRKIPAGRMGAPSELGPMVCLLASSASDFVTGAVWVTDGGETAKL